MTVNELPHKHSHGSDSDAVLSMLPYTENFGELSDIFALLGDCSRLRIFWLLCHCEECVINISALMNMTSPAVSHHLKLLKSAGLIISRRSGKEVYYTAAETKQTMLLHDAIENLSDIICTLKNK